MQRHAFSSKCGRLTFLLATTMIAVPQGSTAAQYAEFLGPHETETLALRGRIPGTGRIGGMTMDSYGYLYVANQDEGVWKIHPSGEVEQFVKGLYGSGGNAVLPNGDLLQSSFNGNEIIRVERDGTVHPFAGDGLNGPVGITAVRTGDVFVANYRGNYISRISKDGQVSEFARDDRFQGLNGITSDRNGNLYVVNLGNTLVLRVTPDGAVSEIATLPGTANAHVALAGGALYVTQIWSHVVLRVQMDGSYEVVAGDGTRRHADGIGTQSGVPYPNGIVASPAGDVLYFNTLRGNMIAGHEGTIDVRRLHVPSPRRAFLQAYERGGMEGLRATFDEALHLREITPAQLAAGVYGIAKRFLDLNVIEPGLALTEWMAEHDEDQVRANLQVGAAHAVYGDKDVAVAHLERAVELDPDNEGAKRQLEAARVYRVR